MPCAVIWGTHNDSHQDVIEVIALGGDRRRRTHKTLTVEKRIRISCTSSKITMKLLYAVYTILPFSFWVASGDDICYLPLDVMFLQDTTGSFDDDLVNVVKQIPDMVAAINVEHPNSFFGVAEFKDKPFFPLGEPDDFCYKLGDGKLSVNMEDFEWAYSLLYASGGGDLPEDIFQALINVALDPAVGWRPVAESIAADDMTHAGARLVILSTDAVPQLPGNINKYAPDVYPDLPRSLPVNSGKILTGDVNYECRNQDYPSPDQVKAALQLKNIYLAILTPEMDNITAAWKWVNEDLLGQPPSFYRYISADSANLIDGVLDAIASVTEYVCPTTTATPTTLRDTTLPAALSTVSVAEGSTQYLIVDTSSQVPTIEGLATPAFDATTVPAVASAVLVRGDESTQASTTTVPEPAPASAEARATEVVSEGIEESNETASCLQEPCDPCCPAVVIKFRDAPQNLVVDYEK
eukprot:Blabericola_migrator_1__6054@NODE_3052_length_2079_cov_1477_803181_g1906_i0_p1_GENE_NODE_3052_length_2079_cov_1477_803181_g1906_i0NODE_3052_length_2079_cov_1477_803181_g1906_i0_p1_ORF_typecomplete_len466_score81_34Integrin_beta/PF00362_18/2_7e24VWA/PF00092_28/0_02_NODE_3052_length_2079_cov_1477_803181_g1906_i01791576